MSLQLALWKKSGNRHNDAATPVYGPDNAQVAVVEFFDYQCTYCIAMAPGASESHENPSLRYGMSLKNGQFSPVAIENSPVIAAQRGLCCLEKKVLQGLC